MPKGFLSPVKNHNDAIRFVVFHQRVQHGAKAVNRIGYLSTCGGHVGWQCEKGAICQRVAIERHQFHSVMNITNLV